MSLEEGKRTSRKDRVKLQQSDCRVNLDGMRSYAVGSYEDGGSAYEEFVDGLLFRYVGKFDLTARIVALMIRRERRATIDYREDTLSITADE